MTRAEREEAKRRVKAALPDYLRNMGIDPEKQFTCLNPEHPDRHPSMGVAIEKDGLPRAHCFACGANYSTFDLIALQYGLTDNKAIFQKAYELFGLDGRQGAVMMNAQPITKKTQQATSDTQHTTSKESDLDLMPQIEEAHKALLKTRGALNYLMKTRGLSLDIIKEYKLGYHPEGYNGFFRDFPDHQSKSRKASLYRLFFPYFDEAGGVSYVLSEIADRKLTDQYNGKYRKPNGLKGQLFNERYIKTGEPVVFVCEGVYDALSVEMAGGKAIAFIGTGHVRFLTLCKEYRPSSIFILSLDSDEAGRKATERIKAGLDELGIPYIDSPPTDGKDFNEAMLNNKQEFFSYISGAVEAAENVRREKEEAERAAYMETSAGRYLPSFVKDIEESVDIPFYPTGFQVVDSALDGGLYGGSLYIIGAISSLGKTTLCLQIIDNIAASGADCIVFSLEMAKRELMGKSISRLTMGASTELHGGIKYAKTLRGIMTGARYKNYTQADRDVIDLALMNYAKFADHIFIHEGVGDIGVMDIRQTIERHIRLTGRRPVILLDYVQILAPYNDRATDKQNTDKAVLELKRICRDFMIPVLAISSFNRENYTESVTMAAFKESGAIEYSSDCLIGLQYMGMDYDEGESADKHRKRVRSLMDKNTMKGKMGKPIDVQLKILKHRNGAKGEARLVFYSWYNCFMDRPEDFEDLDEESEIEIPY